METGVVPQGIPCKTAEGNTIIWHQPPPNPCPQQPKGTPRSESSAVATLSRAH